MKDLIPPVKFNEKRQRYELYYQKLGKRKLFTTREPNLLQATLELQKACLLWIEDNYREIPHDLRLKKAWELYIEDYREHNKITSYNQLKGRGQAHIVPALGNKNLQAISKMEWQGIIDKAYRKHAKAYTTLRGLKNTIITFCKWCASRGFLDDDKVPLYLSIPKNSTKPEKQVLQPSQLQVLFDPENEDDFYIHCFRFIALTGLRRGEFCGLRSIDFDGRYIRPQQAISHEGCIVSLKTENAEREILLSELAMKELRAHQAISPSKEYLFTNPDGHGITPRVLRNHWQRWRELHGIDISIHELRHTFISYSRLKTDENLEKLKQLYGHAKAMNTDAVYVHDIELTPAEREKKEAKDKELANKLDEVFKFFTQK